MRLSKGILSPVGVALMVAAFWATMAIMQRAGHVPASDVAYASGLEAKSSGQGFGQAMHSMGAGSGTGQNASAPDGRNWWGVTLRARRLNMDEDEPPMPAGEVISVTAGSPAAAAGLRKGDLIVGAQREQISSVSGLEQTVATVPAGGRLSLQLLRGGMPIELAISRGVASAAGPQAQGAQPSAPAAPMAQTVGPASQGRTGIFVNERELTPQQVQQLRMTYGYVAPPGRYWYDAKSGLYGVIGREAAGFMQPGHDFGPLPANASNGKTGVFINGRQINMVEAMFCRQLFGAVYQGRWWLDGRTGNLGMEGSPMPVANVFMALQQAQRSAQQGGGGGGYSWHSRITGAYGGSDGKCSYVSIPGSGSVMTGNCD